MGGEASIAINGEQLSEEESAIVRMSVEAFTIAMAQGIEEQDEGVKGALTEPYLRALIAL
jgi:hypothetical protein